MSVNMNRLRLIVVREWSSRIRQRSFLITTAVMIVVAFALVLAPTVVAAVFGEDDEDATAATVLVIDRTGTDDIVSQMNTVADAADLGEEIVFRAGDPELDLGAAISDGDADGAFTVTRGDAGALEFVYTNEDGVFDQTATLAYTVAGNVSLTNSLAQAGVDAEQMQQIRMMPEITLQSVQGDNASAEDTEQGFRYGTAYVSAVVLYMVVLMYGMWVAQGVVEEKSSRIMEIMINAASPTELMFGKIIGIGVAGLTQILPILIVAVVGLLSQEWLADTLEVTGIDLSGIDFGAISATLIVYFLIYFLLGFLLYAALYAGAGSLVSRQEDVSTMTTPMTLLVVGGFFGAIFTLSAPDSRVAQIVSIFPFTSPMAMVPRLLLGDPTAWEIGLSIGLLAVTGYLAVWFAARIYRMGVLMYGQKPSFKVIFRRDTVSAAR